MLPEGGESPPELFLPGLARGAARLGLLWDERTLDRLARYLARLDAARRRTNLTGPFPSEELIAHALESGFGAGLVPPGPAADVGSGAGFPGVVVAILRPDVSMIPVEPRRLRREFLDGCGSELPIPNLAAALSSVKLLPRGSVSAALARAVGGIELVLRGAEFVRPGGLFLAWTTQPQVAGLGRALAPAWELEQAIPVPGAERKQIAVFRHRRVRGGPPLPNPIPRSPDPEIDHPITRSPDHPIIEPPDSPVEPRVPRGTLLPSRRVTARNPRFRSPA